MIKKILRHMGCVLGLFCSLLVVAELFYFGTNNYFNFLGEMRDFSVSVWLLMFFIIGCGFYFWLKKNKPFMMMFAIWLVVVCFAFDFYRFVIFCGEASCELYIKIILAIELLLIVGAVNFKLIDFLHLTIAAFLCTLGGYYFLYPVIFPAKSIVLMTSAGALMWIFWRQHIIKGKMAAVLMAVALIYFIYGIAVGLWMIYDRTHGIHFYERPVTEVSQNIKVSIVVPVYNAENTIERALDSLRHQTLKDIEIICVDDGSTDNTPAILKKYAAFDKRIKVIRQENAFIGMARNRGMEEAKGEFIGFIDSDDWVSLDYYEELYKIALEKGTKIAETKFIYHVINEYYPRMQHVMTVRGAKQNNESKPILGSSFLGFSRIYSGYVWDKIYKRSFLRENHIDFTPYRTIYEDSYFAFQIYMSGEPIAIASSGDYYYYQGASYTRRVIDEPTDEAVPFFLAFRKMIKDKGFDKEKEEALLEINKKHRNRCFRNYYESLSNDQAKKIWRERVLKAFPDGEIDFDKIDQEIAEEKDKKKEKQKVPLY